MFFRKCRSLPAVEDAGFCQGVQLEQPEEGSELRRYEVHVSFRV